MQPENPSIALERLRFPNPEVRGKSGTGKLSLSRMRPGNTKADQVVPVAGSRSSAFPEILHLYLEDLLPPAMVGPLFFNRDHEAGFSNTDPSEFLENSS